jgi:hypothetical protein
VEGTSIAFATVIVTSDASLESWDIKTCKSFPILGLTLVLDPRECSEKPTASATGVNPKHKKR